MTNKLTEIPEKASSGQAPNEIPKAVANLWLKYKKTILERIDTIEGIIKQLAGNGITDESRQTAERNAHSIAGSAGTFGFPEGTRIARELEHLFESNDTVGLLELEPVLTGLVASLRAELSKDDKTEKSDSKTTEAPVNTQESLNGSPSGASKTASLRILHIEDDEVFQSLVRTQLFENLPFELELELVKSGSEALLKLQLESFDLILLDYMLPDIQGLSLLEELRKRKIITPIIFISGQNDQRVTIKAMKEGADDYILKSDLLSDTMPLVKAIAKLVLETAVSIASDKDEVVNVLELLSKSERIRLELRTSLKLVPPSGVKVPIPTLLSTLGSLEKMNIVSTNPVMTIVKCPKCGALENMPAILCPECQSQLMEKSDTMQHLKCNGIDFTSNYQIVGEQYVCPNCRKNLKEGQADFRKLGSWYKCNNKHVFETPSISYKCLNCTALFSLKSSKIEILNEYRLTEGGRQKMRLKYSQKLADQPIQQNAVH